MRRFSRNRRVVIMAFALAVVTQSPGASPCHCNDHGDTGSMVGAHSEAHGHGMRQGEQHADATITDAGHVAHSVVSDQGASPDSACQCDACGQGFGLIVQTVETPTTFPAKGAMAPPRYLEPPQRRALRPPIQV